MSIMHLLAKGHPVREWTESIVIAVVLAVFIRMFFVQVYKIPTGSMRMTLIEGDRILVNKLKYGPLVPLTDRRFPGYGRLHRGDIIVFKSPEDPKKHFVKRFIAFPGETVEIKEGDVYINGEIITQDVIKNVYYYNKGDYGARGEKINVPEDHYFVLGDNSSSSMDSRFFGFVPQHYLVGKAEFIYWPLHRVRVLK